MGSAKRRQARRRTGVKPGSKSASNQVLIGPSNPFPICSVPSSIPPRYRNIVDNLSSNVALHRAISCSALSNIVCGDHQAASELICAGLVPVVLPLVVDADSDVATHAAGLLRNLAVMDGAAFADIARNAFDNIIMLLLNRAELPPTPWNAQILALIASLTEYDVKSALIGNGAIWKLSSFLPGPSDAATAVLEIFRNVIDDRPKLAQELVNHLSVLRPLFDNESILVRAHTAALFATIARLTSSPALLSEIAPHLFRCANIDLSAAKHNLIQEMRRAHAEIDAELERQRAAHSGETIFQESIGGRLAPEALEHSLQGLVQSFRAQAVAVQVVAEAVANLICVDQDEPTWVLNQVVDLAGIRQLAPILADRIRTVIDDERLNTEDWGRVLDLIYGAVERCVESMINFVLNEIVTGSDAFDLTMEVIEREYRRTEPRLSLLEVSGRLLSLSLSSAPRDLHPSHLDMMATLMAQSPSEAVRQEFVGALVRFGMGNASRADLVAEIVCSRFQDDSVRVFLEAANGLIDMFADDGVHAKTLVRLNLLPKLSAIVADDRRWECCDEELLEEASETRTNLQAFVQYRSACP